MVHQLNEKQNYAVAHIEGPLLVLAGAGSGKTRVVTERILHLMDQGVPASKILAVTFTNKAAAEMRSRVNERYHMRQQVLICTFHSLGVRILRESISSLGWPTDFVIYDPDDCEKVIKDCLADMGVANDKQVKSRTFLELISRAKNDLLGPEKVSVGDLPTPYRDLFTKVYSHYLHKMQQSGALDFDDLIYLPVRLFRSSEQLLKSYQDRWEFILVDEYQDTNQAQYTMAKQLVGPRCNLFVVGDPDQSIYSWRGAQISNILSFETDFKGAQLVRLEQNYRSTSTILEAANAVISNNAQRYEKRLWSNRGIGEKIQLFVASDEREEASFIVASIKTFIAQGHNPKEIAIFYRTNSQSRPFEEHLMAHRIPYNVIGAQAFYQRREVKDLLAFLRMLVSDGDFVAFSRTINLPKRGLGAATIDRLRLAALNEGQPILAVCRFIAEGQGAEGEQWGIKLNKRQKGGLKEYLALISSLRSSIDQLSLKDLLLQLLERSGYLVHLMEEDPIGYEDRKGNIDSLLARTVEWQQQNPEGTLTLFLQELSLQTSEEKEELNDCVSLMTLHNGKGLEFPIVFLAGLEEGLLPHINSDKETTQLEEERRLCYVGMTRAQDRLILTRSRSRMIWGMTRSNHASRFLKEIPKEYYERIRHDREFYVEQKAQPLIQNTDSKIHSDESLAVGDNVFHADFGKGQIRSVGQSSLGLTYRVFFSREGSEKALIAKYAYLKKIG